MKHLKKFNESLGQSYRKMKGCDQYHELRLINNKTGWGPERFNRIDFNTEILKNIFIRLKNGCRMLDNVRWKYLPNVESITDPNFEGEDITIKPITCIELSNKTTKKGEVWLECNIEEYNDEWFGVKIQEWESRGDGSSIGINTGKTGIYLCDQIDGLFDILKDFEFIK